MVSTSVARPLTLAAAAFAVPVSAMAATPAVAADVFQLSSAAGWGGAIGAGIGFLIGSVPKGDGWGWTMSGAVTGAATGGLIGGGLGQMLSGSLISGGVMTGLGVLIGVTRYMATREPTPSVLVGKPLQDGINRFDGADEKTKYQAAVYAFKHAAFANGETRSSNEWRFSERGPEDGFKETLADALHDPEFDIFNSLVLLTRNLPAAHGDPAVVVIHGGGRLRQVVVGTDGLKLPDGTEVPFSSMRAAVGFAGKVRRNIMPDIDSYFPQRPGLIYKMSGGALRRPDPDQCVESLKSLSDALVTGQVPAGVLPDRADLLQFEIDGAQRSTKLPWNVKSLLTHMQGDPQQASENMAAILTSYMGYRETAQGELSVDQRANFDGTYGNYKQAGETYVMTVTVLQPQGATASDPAAVKIDYRQPAFLEPHTIPNTSLDGRSASNTLYFLEHLSDAAGLQDLTAPKSTVAPAFKAEALIEKLVASLDQNSPVQFHQYTVGYGRVGTEYCSSLIAHNTEISGHAEQTAGALVGLYGVTQVLHAASI